MTTAAPEQHPATLIPVPRTAPPRTALGRWMFAGGSPEDVAHQAHQTHAWYRVLWLTGVDYFSTLGYQPGIALLAAGAISPIATLILVFVTLFALLPIYGEVARRSYNGQGSIAMLERLLPGWKGKVFVLVMLGFASTGFVVTMTLSAADAAEHIVENPLLHPYFGDAQLVVTLVLLTLLALVFLRGFGDAIGVAMAVGIPYILLNLVVIGRGLLEIARHPEHLAQWQAAVAFRGDWTAVLLVAAVALPRLALGMSGFETGVSVMPLVKGSPPDPPAHEDHGGEQSAEGRPEGRIRATRRLLTAAAAIMSVMLIGTSFVTAVLIPEEAYREGGKASGRALAWLSHDLLGAGFGTLYDVSTILILWFAGSSAMVAMLTLIPRYLPRFGMAPRWVSYARPLVLVLFVVDVLVTLWFDADVAAQGGAYATGVLALFLSAAVAVALARGQEARAARPRRFSLGALYAWGAAAIFLLTLVQNSILRPDGVVIALLFVLAVMGLSALSRWRRATEFRVESLAFADAESASLWEQMVGRKVNLVPLRTAREAHRKKKAAEIRSYYAVKGSLAFLHVHLRDDRSAFTSSLKIAVRRSGDDFVVHVKGAVAIANTIAYTSELLDPRSIFLGLTRENPMSQALKYLLWGQGETGILVYHILIRYWAWTPEDDVRPLIFLMSE
ncbi:hypothetical protein L6R50_10010 [Myxococcota bacterium]|nr:hypothetical protein [Myxococcota bacterium]